MTAACRRQIASKRAELRVSRRKEESALWGGRGAETFEHLPGNRMAAVLELSGDFLFVSRVQEVRGPQRTSGLTVRVCLKSEARYCLFGVNLNMHDIYIYI